ncbi:glycosyltransferase [Kocuria sp. UCD-OTCP]|uniref:glycosyltransferase n=1 Tax=Kocuria sp. UCD-OTCP TaxID=1292021 RepID=UPI00036EC385|nr:glycosyltransferase [Kocuria sp. UCD-OTCP]EYT52787.1 sucrose synthase (sucrose-UDP glucosyltransferase) [Kocuria sp. UCD-OTCP]
MTFAAPRAPSTSAERTGAATHEALEAVRRAPSILDGIRRADDLLQAVREDPAGALPVLAEEIRRRDDHVAAIAAVHALASVPGSRADTLLTALLDDEPWLREHTAGALADRAPLPRAVAPLADLVTGGGFPGMLAQRTLQAWAPAAPDTVGTALEHALAGTVNSGPRARLTETLGLVPGAGPAARLRALAGSPGEDQDVRGAALEALVDRGQTGAESVADLTDLAGACADADGPLAAVARLALADLHAAAGPAPASRGDGLTVLQPFLHAEIDRDLTFSGRGDNGGIATLLAQLGDALSAPDGPGGVAQVLTVSRGTHDEARAATARPAGAGHVFGVVPFAGPPVHMADAWPRRVAAERGLRRVLRRAGPVDVLHLRMADVGSMAAAAVAAELGIPWVLTMAPDPHALVAARERAGTLTRAGFGAADGVEHLWFRVRLLADLAARAEHLVLFPRPDLARDARELLDVDLDEPGRCTVVPEGIDLGAVDRAAQQVRTGAGAHLAELDTVLAALPAARRGLPLVVTVGRLHRVKGTATLVEAWARDAGLRDRCNLLVVGGDLVSPSADEREQLTRIDAALPRAEAATAGLLLAGHRPHATVAAWLAAVRRGRPGLSSPAGVYVCASLKEEFGVALVEALATGLPVVAPDAGGPATFVADGVTGVLVDTGDPAALARAVARALDLAARPDAERTADAARAMVRDRFSIEGMATALTSVYDDAVAHTADRSPTP